MKKFVDIVGKYIDLRYIKIVTETVRIFSFDLKCLGVLTPSFIKISSICLGFLRKKIPSPLLEKLQAAPLELRILIET